MVRLREQTVPAEAAGLRGPDAEDLLGAVRVGGALEALDGLPEIVGQVGEGTWEWHIGILMQK